MGSAVPQSRGPCYPRTMFQDFQRRVDEAAEVGESADVHSVADILADALAHPDTRRKTILALASFILESMGGVPPNPNSWIPPAE